MGSGAAAPAGVHRIGTVAVFRFLFDAKKEQVNGRLLFPCQPGTKRKDPRLNAVSPAATQHKKQKEGFSLIYKEKPSLLFYSCAATAGPDLGSGISGMSSSETMRSMFSRLCSSSGLNRCLARSTTCCR